jgi:hypothetical protein
MRRRRRPAERERPDGIDPAAIAGALLHQPRPAIGIDKDTAIAASASKYVTIMQKTR